MSRSISQEEYSALLDRHNAVLEQVRAAGGEVSFPNDQPKITFPKAEKPSDALKKANEKLAELEAKHRDSLRVLAKLPEATDELVEKRTAELAKVAADARERADAAEARAAELQKMLDELTAPPAAQPST